MTIQRFKTWHLLLWGLLALGLFFRFYKITDNQFLFYDEGMYLGYNREFLNLVASNQPKDLSELFVILGVMFKMALGTAKALWFYILNLRVFGIGVESWSFARVVSALAGIMTIALTYVFAIKYFKSQRIAVISALILCFLPSHVFYSRLGMQESLSALLFLSSISVYLFLKEKSWSAILASILMYAVFSTNYRMIIGPIFIMAIELLECLFKKEKFNLMRIGIFLFVFSLLVVLFGSLYGGINYKVTFGWMMHQAQEAKEQGNVLSFLSYPVYTIILEGVFLAIAFWFNLYFVIRKEYHRLLPFILVIIQMGLFSFAAEKGARYLCVLLPMMAIAAGVCLDYCFDFFKKNKALFNIYLALLLCSLVLININLISSTTDYQKAITTIISHDPEAKILSTQPLVEQLYVKNERNIRECPKNLSDFIMFYSQGYKYLVVDPQIYISWTKNTYRFSPPLIDFLEFITLNVKPIISFPHMSRALMDRFILDHNQNLSKTINFLNEYQKAGYNEIRVYDIQQCIFMLKNQMQSMSNAGQ